MSVPVTVTRRDTWPVSSQTHAIRYPTPNPPLEWPKPLKEVTPIGRGISTQITYAIHVLDTVISMDENVRGGVPVLIGTRVPVSRLFAEVATGRSIREIADDKELDLDAISGVFRGFAAYLARPFGT